jgi:hypothetical protein
MIITNSPPADAALHGGAVAFVVRVREDRGARGRRAGRRAVARPVVNDDDLAPAGGARQRRDDLADDVGFVVRGDDNRDR